MPGATTAVLALSFLRASRMLSTQKGVNKMLASSVFFRFHKHHQQEKIKYQKPDNWAAAR